MKYIIREIQESDYDLLKDFVYESLYVHEGEEPFPREILETEELQVYTKDFGKMPDDYGFVAEVDGKVVGMVWARIMDDYGHVDDETPSLSLAVYKDYHKNGIGTALLNRILECLKGKGYRQTSLSCQTENYAVKMYFKAGFEVLIDKGEEYIMVCRLN